MPHDARDIANELIRRGTENHRVFTHLQIQNLVYYCHAWMLAIYGEPIVNQEVAAWEHGPVIVDLYHALRKYGRDQVQVIPRIRRETYEPKENGIIDAVLHQYGGLSGVELSSLTHAASSPWDETVRKQGKRRNIVIPNDLIKSHYGDTYQKFQNELTEAQGQGQA